MARTFSTMMNRNGEIGQPCLIPDLRKRSFDFSPLSVILAVGLFSCLAKYLHAESTTENSILTTCFQVILGSTHCQ